MRAPTGEQFTIARDTANGRAEVTIAEVAASLRAYSVGGIDIVDGFAENEAASFASGIVLVPWPNRVVDGKWTHDGVVQQLDLSEPDKSNAIHGLLATATYRLVERTESSVTLAATVYPQRGFPFIIDTTVRYELVEDGLTVTHSFSNPGTVAAPVAVGTHGFYTIGDVPSEDLVLTLAASSHIEVDERLNPTGVVALVDGTPFDLRGGKRLGDLDLDDAFGALSFVDGQSIQSLEAPDGRRVEIWQDENHGFVQVFTTRRYPRGGVEGLAVAIEPMTAPANALNTGEGLRWLAPGEQWTVVWGVRYSVPNEGE